MNWVGDCFRISCASSVLIIVEVGGLRLILIIYFRYLLLMEFKVCTLSYRLRFFQLTYGPNARHASHKSMGKNKDLAYGLVSECR